MIYRCEFRCCGVTANIRRPLVTLPTNYSVTTRPSVSQSKKKRRNDCPYSPGVNLTNGTPSEQRHFYTIPPLRQTMKRLIRAHTHTPASPTRCCKKGFGKKKKVGIVSLNPSPPLPFLCLDILKKNQKRLLRSSFPACWSREKEFFEKCESNGVTFSHNSLRSPPPPF